MHVDFLIILVGESTFRSTVPARSYVLLFWVRVYLAAAAKISNFQGGVLEKDVLRFDVAVENLLLVHVGRGSDQLENKVSDDRGV